MTISGHFIYNNLSISQHQNVIEPFSNMISKIKPERVLEIGTSQGGLTLMIRDILDQYGLYQTDLTTYDIYDPVYLKNSISTENKNITIKCI
jgi:cephalosporin hydroxylase